ncbi:stage V sporulation K [Podospora aff. communis PSN243]|uniref:Stage V sporulation K n=1 Tax=Podospora aff. communis PSN243 TaxID=3040156 RepID=A0AAV9GC74_9PEZI|nr:stage V sporulation K [Podospora aff. communis PSN243]
MEPENTGAVAAADEPDVRVTEETATPTTQPEFAQQESFAGEQPQAELLETSPSIALDVVPGDNGDQPILKPTPGDYIAVEEDPRSSSNDRSDTPCVSDSTNRPTSSPMEPMESPPPAVTLADNEAGWLLAEGSPVVRRVVRRSLQRRLTRLHPTGPDGESLSDIPDRALPEEVPEVTFWDEFSNVIENAEEFLYDPKPKESERVKGSETDSNSTEGDSGLGAHNNSSERESGLEADSNSTERESEPQAKEPEDPLLLINDNSASRLEWIRQKRDESAALEAFDKLMGLLGRENVKSEFLSMKAAIDARRRRGETEYESSIKFDVEGNVGTGKETIMNLYSSFRRDCRYQSRYSDDPDNSRPPGRHRVAKLEDFTEEELHEFIKRALQNRKMRVEGVEDNPDIITRILAKRIAQRRGTESFRNLKEVDDALTEACDRQADRLQRERRLWTGDDEEAQPPEYLFFLTKEDLLGLPPPDIRQTSAAYRKLQAMTGLSKIKKSVEELMDLAKRNYFLEMNGKRQIQFNSNRVFLGPPGSGKTTFAKLFGQIVADIGLVSKRLVVLKDPSDFISRYAGGDEENTRKILDDTQGKVLIIDDAHGLCFRSGPGQERNIMDQGMGAIHDTIVAKTSTEPGQDRCIILVGYTDKMHDLLERANPGLRSRFPLEDAFEFLDYEVPELMSILDAKIVNDDIEITEDARLVASRVLTRARERPGFGNGRDVHNLVNRARTAHKDRQEAAEPTKENDQEKQNAAELPLNTKSVVLEPVDFDPHWEREWGAADCKELFQGFVGFEGIVKQFQEYQQVVGGMRLHGKDPRPHIPFTFVFKGPPGTGKTSTARKVGQIFYDMGFLASDEVIECSASDLIGQYVGQTAPVVQSFLERALGKVLFIDEAYRLASGSKGSFGSSYEEEAVGELVDGLTKKRYIHKIVVILAGYSDDMDFLMKSNRGLRGRFTAEVIFPQLTPKQSIKYLGELIGKMGITIWDKVTPAEEEKEKVYKLIRKLGGTRDWSNGRDIETLANTIIGKVFQKEGEKGEKSDRLRVSTQEFIEYLKEMYRARLAGELIDRE